MINADLTRLNAQSESRRRLTELKFIAPDLGKFWAPMELAPLSHLPAFGRLTQAQQVRYNQLFALGILEQFIWFEEGLICPILQKVLRLKDVEPDLQLAITHFIREERSHSAMFWRLLQASAPEIYAKRRFQLLKIKPWQNMIFNLFKLFPRQLVGWIWLTVFFEERTLAFSTRYMHGRENIDGNFVQAHLRHLQDETGHVQMDEHFVEEFFVSAKPWQRGLASLTMNLMLRIFSSPRRVSGAILERMRSEFSDFSEDLEIELLNELENIRDNRNYLQIAFGEDATRRTRSLLARHLEMAPTLRRLVAVGGTNLEMGEA